MGDWGATKAAYNLLDGPPTVGPALSAPHRAATRARAAATTAPVLFIQGKGAKVI
jgi:hypothetical protein